MLIFRRDASLYEGDILMDHGPRSQTAPPAVAGDIAPLPKVADEVGWHRLGPPDTRHVGVSDRSEQDSSRFSIRS